MAKKGEWVQVSMVVLSPEERAPQVPDDTKEVPLMKLVKGYLKEEAELGEEAQITTITGRTETGELVDINPVYTHSFGQYVPEIVSIHQIIAEEFYGGGLNE